MGVGVGVGVGVGGVDASSSLAVHVCAACSSYSVIDWTWLRTFEYVGGKEQPNSFPSIIELSLACTLQMQHVRSEDIGYLHSFHPLVDTVVVKL